MGLKNGAQKMGLKKRRKEKKISLASVAVIICSIREGHKQQRHMACVHRRLPACLWTTKWLITAPALHLLRAWCPHCAIEKLSYIV